MGLIASEVSKNVMIIFLTFLFSMLLMVLFMYVFLYVVGHYVNFDKIIEKSLGF